MLDSSVRVSRRDDTWVLIVGLSVFVTEIRVGQKRPTYTQSLKSQINSTHHPTPRESLAPLNNFTGFEPSLQSSFHLSLTVLVCYRSLVVIQPWMPFTTHFGLQSQTTRLPQTCWIEWNLCESMGLSPSLALIGKKDPFQRTRHTNTTQISKDCKGHISLLFEKGF